jgi:hypothetical protein
MFFVLAMQVLSDMVKKAMEEQIFSPLPGINATQRMSAFADDVVLFIRLTAPDLHAVMAILQVFGEASGLHVNFEKTAATVIRGSEKEARRVKNLLAYEIEEFPIRYLGLQLVLRPFTKVQWLSMLDRALAIMPPWQKGPIPRAGRLILVKNVISSRPVHHLLVSEAPAWLFDEQNGWLCAFFWARKDKVHGGCCLVSWEKICWPYAYEGPGIKNLQLQGIALRARWEWLDRTYNDRPWKELPMLKDARAHQIFQSYALIKIGDGRTIFFWPDR